MVLCFSPVGDKFRIRARQFPALVNCTAFDWFHGWPHEALVSVAQRFLVDIPDIDEPVRELISYHMAFVHTEVTAASVAYFQVRCALPSRIRPRGCCDPTSESGLCRSGS